MQTTARILVSLALAACGDGVGRAPVPAPPAADAWIGRWAGPEGTYLEIGRQPGAPGTYAVTVADLDGPRTFPGTAQGDGLVFTRDGVAQTLRPGDGDATGMKWLAGKQDCLLVEAGEGWCRD